MSNNKQMKLYTEEQVRNAMDFARGHHRMSDTQFIETLTPIELPSDSEIIEASHNIKYTQFIPFAKGAKWMRDKIQAGNNEQQ